MLAARLIVLSYTPFAFIKNIRNFYHDEIITNGAISNFILAFYLIYIQKLKVRVEIAFTQLPKGIPCLPSTLLYSSELLVLYYFNFDSFQLFFIRCNR